VTGCLADNRNVVKVCIMMKGFSFENKYLIASIILNFLLI
jgi:hypothetical protein